jgi:2-polyprenyl-6-methoxyphenol hydroxylase-like FAD-dependent oxidoreductase
VGLAVALGLAREGVRSVVLEKAPAPAPFARAGVVLPRTLEIFRSWELIDELRAAAITPDSLHVCDARDGRELAHVDFSLLRDESLDPAPFFLPQARTEAILRSAVERSGYAEIRFGHELVDLAAGDADVRVTVRPHAEGLTPYDLHAAFLVGADGGTSTVRSRLGINLEGETYPVKVALAVVRIDDARDALPWPRLRFDDDQYLAALRFAPHRWRVVWTLRAGESDEAALAHQAIERRVRSVLGAGPYEVEWASAFHIHRRHAATFVTGRVVLAGDAAHLNSPVGGQGMNAGIADAQNLAWKLAVALRGGDAERLLESYDAERRSAIVVSVERVTDRATKLMLATSPPLRRAAFIAAGALFRLRPLARRALRIGLLLGARYVDSPILTGPRRWVGRRAPDPQLAATGQAVLVLSSTLAGQYQLPPGVLTLIVDEARARHWKAPKTFAALVRPDGYVGWFAARPSREAIEAAVPRALGF